NDGKSLKMTCKLSKKIQYPFCQMMFLLGDGARGVDFSGYDYVTFDLSASGPGPGPQNVRNSIMNFESGISRIDDWMSTKIHEIWFPADGATVRKVPLNVYQVPGWWVDQQKIPLEQTGIRMDNVICVEIQTANTPQEGTYVIDVRSLRFHGKLISLSKLLGILTAAWIAVAVAWPIYAAVRMRAQLNSSRQRLALLGEINKALQLETKELVGQADLDPLTGALNRQGLRAAMMSTSTLLTDPMSVIFVDLDHFKRINDQHGHEVGDAVLRDFATTVSREIRSSDRLVRWGGEEFLIICPNTMAAQAYGLANKLRAAMPQHKWPVGLQVTASFGIASLGKREEISVVIKRADAALYRAKANGRDRVEVAMDDDSVGEIDAATV
ncbi:MAG: GGDEF domain-containing protein, partial [Gammaproteobacteria bacterium]